MAAEATRSVPESDGTDRAIGQRKRSVARKASPKSRGCSQSGITRSLFAPEETGKRGMRGRGLPSAERSEHSARANAAFRVAALRQLSSGACS